MIQKIIFFFLIQFLNSISYFITDNKESLQTKNIEVLTETENIHTDCHETGGYCWQHGRAFPGVHLKVN